MGNKNCVSSAICHQQRIRKSLQEWVESAGINKKRDDAIGLIDREFAET